MLALMIGKLSAALDAAEVFHDRGSVDQAGAMIAVGQDLVKILQADLEISE